MFDYPYETKTGTIYSSSLKDIRNELQKAMANRELIPLRTLGDKPVNGVDEVPPYLKHIHPFAHPIEIDFFGDKRLVIDTRPFVRNYNEGDPKIISNRIEYQLQCIRVALTKSWASGAYSEFAAFAEFPAMVFTRMIAEGLVRRLGLSPQDQMVLSVITALYFFEQFSFKERMDEDRIASLAGRIFRVTAVPAETTLQIINGLPQFRSIDDYIAVVTSTIENPRIQRLNIGMFFALFTGYWWGAGAREMMGMSFEHPPTFFTLVYSAMTERSFNSSLLSKTAQTVDRKNSSKDFVKGLTLFITGEMNGY